MTTRAAAKAAFEADEDLDAARERLGAALPAEGWISDYLRAVVPLTDAPVEFSLISGLAAIATCMGNATWITTWGQQVHPHLWAVLVAPSSFWRKSTAINMAERVLRLVDPTLLLPSDFSREKLLVELSARPIGLLSLKEFGGLLAAMGKDYMAGTRETMTELFDSPEEYTRALKSGSVTVRRPAINILGATTLSWLETRISAGEISGGFYGRFLWVKAKVKASPKGLTEDVDGTALYRLKEALIELRKEPEGPSRFTPAALQLLNAWISTWEGETGAGHSEDLSGFAVRLQTYAVKLAMVYQASRWLARLTKELRLVDEISVGSAIAYCRIAWRNVATLVDQEMATTKDAKDLRRILLMIPRGGMSRSRLIQLAHHRTRELDQLLDTLVQSEQIVVRTMRPADVGIERTRQRPLTWISRTDPEGPDSSLTGGDSSLTVGTSYGSLRVSANPKLTVSDPEAANWKPTESQLYGPIPPVESLTVNSSHTHSLTSDIETHTRVREGAKRSVTPGLNGAAPTQEDPAPPAADDDSRWDLPAGGHGDPVAGPDATGGTP